MAIVNLLSDVDVLALSIVKSGANRKRIFLKKSAEDDDSLDLFDLPSSSSRLLKSEWSTFYCVVAEPDAHEAPGQTGDQDVDDMWASSEEIRKAAHRFMKNGGLVNKMHESLEPYGRVVENAVALDDFKVGGELIKAGSWYVAIEPTEEGCAAIDSGEFTGLSLQGDGVRTPTELEKAKLTAAARKKLPKGVFVFPDKAPGAGSYPIHDIKHGRNALARASGKPEEGAVKRAVYARYPQLNPKKKGEKMKKTLLGKVAEKLGIDVDAVAEEAEGEELEKALPDFDNLIAERELDDELPKAFDALRSVVWRAFACNEPDAGDPKAVIKTSLDQFGSWAEAVIDRLPLEKREAIAKESATLESIEEDDDVADQSERIEQLEKQVKELTDTVKPLAEGLTKVFDDVEARKAPKVEDLAKSIGEVTTTVTKLKDDIEKLAAGDTSQGKEPDRADIEKSEGQAYAEALLG